jgi:peptidoglycan/LPS O-acetylase OafA/YrhL
VAETRVQDASIHITGRSVTHRSPLSELTSPRGIPSLDGLRAISILLVILAHSSWYFPEIIQHNLPFKLIVGNGRHGVAIFFVISGYLITTLLLREFDKTGTVSLKRFYFRRTLCILPPYYVLLFVMAILWWTKLIPEHLPSFIAAVTYTWACYPRAQGYFIEEQFYLFWPLAFLIWHRCKSLIRASLLIVILMPFVRVALHFIAPGLRGHEDYMIQGWVDALMVGCLLALSKHRAGWVKWQHRYLNGWTASAMAFVAFFVTPLISSSLPKQLTGLFELLVSPTITALCIGGFLVYLVGNTESIGARVLNNRVIRHLGVLSYSLYLWQQVFTSHYLPLLPYGFLYALAAAELSYWLVEKPSFKLRARLEQGF